MGTKVQAVARPCDGELQQHHQMSGEKNGRRTLTLKLSGGGCTVDLKADGRLTFNDDFTDIAALESGGFFRLDVTERGVRRELHIESRNGSLARTWRANGREAGDHYEAETLRKVVRHRAATDRVRDAAVSAAADLSRHYRDEVSRAAGRS